MDSLRRHTYQGQKSGAKIGRSATDRRQQRPDLRRPSDHNSVHIGSPLLDYDFGDDRIDQLDRDYRRSAVVPLVPHVQFTSQRYLLLIDNKSWRTGEATLSIYCDRRGHPFNNPFLPTGVDDVTGAILSSPIIQEEFRSSKSNDGSTDLRDLLEVRRRLRDRAAQAESAAKATTRPTYAEVAAPPPTKPQSEDDDEDAHGISVESKQSGDGKWHTVIRRSRRIQ